MTLPLLVMLLSGLTELGLGMREHTVMLEAARIGARAAAGRSWTLSPTDMSNLALDIAREYLEDHGYAANRYTFYVRGMQVPVGPGVNAPAMKLAIEPVTTLGVYFLSQNALTTCAKEIFLVDAGFLPTDLGGTPGISGACGIS